MRATAQEAVSTRPLHVAAEPYELSKAPSPASTTKKFIRGSSLLLAGRFISIILNFTVQVLIVRYLAKGDYGAFAYALGVVSLGASTFLLGMGKALPRFVPVYHEQKDYARTFGIILVALTTVGTLGAVACLSLYALRDVVAGSLVSDPLALSLLLVLGVLAPVEAFGTLLEKVVAVFARPRAIFFRRHLLAPGLRLLTVLVVMATAGDVYLLAYGYLITGVLGTWVYVTILLREWHRQGLLQHMWPGRLKMPVRELFGFSIPLLSSELSVVLRGSIAIILLEYFHNTAAVAEYRAVLPVAGLNMLVYEAFSFLFVPTASRLFARGERGAIGELYWHTAVWIAVFSFPLLAVTCSLAQPLTVLLFGEQYATGGFVLAVLAIGHYVNAALGFNERTLGVYGNVRFIVTGNVLVGILAIVLSVVLIRRYGAVGAAIATTVGLILHNLFNQVGLRVCRTGIPSFDWPFVRVCLGALLLCIGLLVGRQVLSIPASVSIGCAAIGFLVLVRVTRRVVRPEAAFPELLRIPLVGRLLS